MNEDERLDRLAFKYYHQPYRVCCARQRAAIATLIHNQEEEDDSDSNT